MISWIVAALLGAIPLYFGFNYGRCASGMPLWTRLGLMLSLVLLGLMVASNATGATLALVGVAVAYVAGVGAAGTLAGFLAGLVLGRPEGDA